jgi:tripartite-type tricarboxylate transporter receptor subunit TctC
LLPLAHAQTAAASYPNKPIKIIVPFPAGGTSDAFAVVNPSLIMNKIIYAGA